MNESLKNTYNITMKVPVGSCGSAIGAEQLTFMVMSPTGDMSVYFGKVAESQLDQRKYLEV